MAYSKSYQEVVAGRVREDEVSFYGKNRVAVPGRSVTIAAMGGKNQPTIQTMALEDEAVGKPDGRNPQLGAYLPNSNQTGVN